MDRRAMSTRARIQTEATALVTFWSVLGLLYVQGKKGE
jgi:hypothetical protein